MRRRRCFVEEQGIVSSTSLAAVAGTTVLVAQIWVDRGGIHADCVSTITLLGILYSRERVAERGTGILTILLCHAARGEGVVAQRTSLRVKVLVTGNLCPSGRLCSDYGHGSGRGRGSSRYSVDLQDVVAAAVLRDVVTWQITVERIDLLRIDDLVSTETLPVILDSSE